MADVVKNIQINITADTSKAESNLEQLKQTLSGIEGIVKGKQNSFKFTVSKATLNNLDRLSFINTANIDKLSRSLDSLAAVGKIKSIPTSFTSSIAGLSGLVDQMGDATIAKIEKLAGALAQFSHIILPSFPKSFGTGLSQLHDAIGGLTDDDLTKLSSLGESLQGFNGIDLKGIKGLTGGGSSDSVLEAMDAPMENDSYGRNAILASLSHGGMKDVLTDGVSQSLADISQAAQACFSMLPGYAQTAFKAIGSLAEFAGSAVKVAFNGAVKGVQFSLKAMAAVAKGAFGTVTTVGKVAFSTIRKVGGTALGAVSDKVSSLHKKINKAMLSIGRIALYRAIRRAIQLVTQAFTTGVKNIYAYSAAAGTALAPSLDKLSSSLMQMKNSIGSMAAPLINALTPAINTVINAVSALCDKLAQLFALLSGSSTYSKAIATQYSFGDAISSTGNSASGSKSKLDKYTAGIDELNVIDDSSSGGGSYDATTAFEETTASFGEGLATLIEHGRWAEAGTMIANAINQSVAEIDFAEIGTNIGEKIQNALEFAAGFLQNLDTFQMGQGLATSINSAINEIDFELAGDVWVEKYNKLIQGISGFAQELDWSGIGTSIGDFINGALENFDAKELATGASALASGVFDMLSSALQETDWTLIGEKLKEFFENIDWDSVVSSFFELLGSAFGAAGELVGGVVQIIADKWQEMWEEIFEPYIDENGSLSAEGFLQGIKDALVNIGTWIKENIFDPFIEGFKKAFGIASPSKEMKTQGGYVIDGLWEGIKNAWTKIPEFFTEKLDKVKEIITKKWTEMKQDATDKWNEIKSTISDKWSNMYITVITYTGNIKSHIDTVWNNVKEFFATTWDSIKEKFIGAWDGMKEGIKTPLNAIIGFAETLANSVVKTVNKMIDAINDLCDVDVPEWVPEIGGQHFGLNLPHIEEITIPRLADGGFTDADLFYANENGMPEMIGRIGNRTAVANNGQIVEGIASGVTLANGGVESLLEQLISVVEGKNFSVSIGSKEIGQANEEYTRTRGVYVNRGVFANAY